ncbi:hypothetical protein EON81_18945 [bacterium]|nr:MAG: hypothetical protein EON81_18945 [bacterium]
MSLRRSPDPLLPLSSLRIKTPFFPHSDAPRPRGRRWQFVLAIVLTLVLSLLWWVGVFGGNVREVDPGRLYRSAQLTGDTLEGTMRYYRIRSVVNLRGAQPKAEFYRSEMSVSNRLGAEHRDISLSAYTMPPPGELVKVIAAFDQLPRPILVHCRGGSDRTGLVATLYEVICEGRSVDRAERDQLTWRYGHLAFSRSRAMDRFFDLYRETSHGQGLRDWIQTSYPALYARAHPDENASRADHSGE